MILRVLTIAVATLVAGCSTYSSNIQVGNEQSYLSLKDQREAMRSVRVYDAAPEGSEMLGEVSASRCHRSFVEEAPDEESVINDLRIAAYAKGADVVTGVAVTKESALARNCWYVLNGTAKAFALPAKQ